jgi:arylsulfatase/arylsulfatase A
MYGTVANIDWNVGRLLDLLTQTGQADHTLVVFTSDHGQCPSSLADGKPRFNCGLRGWKGSFYEGGVRVPCFVRWRGAIPAGGLEALANPIDWVPTLASACGYAQPTDRVIDGLDLLPALRRQAPPPDRAIPMQFNRCEIPRRFFNAAVLTPRWKWYRIEPTGPDELYDVPADPGEKHNRAAEHPDIAARLVDVYDRWFDDVSRTRPDNYGPPRIVLGHPSAPLTHLTLQDGRLLGTWEGWGLAFPCYWFVDVRREGDYRFDLDAGDKPAAWGRQWTLRAGDVVSVFVIPNRRHSVTLHLRAGPQTISCLSYGPVPDLYPNQPDPGCRTVGEISVTAIH